MYKQLQNTFIIILIPHIDWNLTLLIHIQLLLDDDFKLSHACSLPGAMSDSLVVNPALHMDQLAQEPPHLAGVKLEGHQGRMVVRGTSPGNSMEHSSPVQTIIDTT